jgi:hypothetical protein
MVMLCVQEVLGSDLGQDIKYPDYCSSAVLLTPSRDNTSVHRHFQFIIPFFHI